MVHFSLDLGALLPEMGGMTLAEYLAESSLNRSQFARQIGVSPETVRRYLDLGRVPAPRVMTKIMLATGCKVTANDFHGVTEAAA
jgi:hypothetical protein